MTKDKMTATEVIVRRETQNMYMKLKNLQKQRDDLLAACQGLLGAMPPALQKKWPNNTKRAKAAIANAEQES